MIDSDSKKLALQRSAMFTVKSDEIVRLRSAGARSAFGHGIYKHPAPPELGEFRSLTSDPGLPSIRGQRPGVIVGRPSSVVRRRRSSFVVGRLRSSVAYVIYFRTQRPEMS